MADDMKRTYKVNEVFWSPQGEGVRAGQMSCFVRFSGCNLRCRVEAGERSIGGFDCDTEFESGRRMDGQQLVDWIVSTVRHSIGAEQPLEGAWIVFTGGEPALQLDAPLCDALRALGFRLAIETNGSVELDCSLRLDWITVSPKVAEHAIRQLQAHEVKYVRAHGQAVPKTRVKALHYIISPAFDGLACDPRALSWCLQLIRENPQWRISVQQHKLWRVR